MWVSFFIVLPQIKVVHKPAFGEKRNSIGFDMTSIYQQLKVWVCVSLTSEMMINFPTFTHPTFVRQTCRLHCVHFQFFLALFLLLYTHHHSQTSLSSPLLYLFHVSTTHTRHWMIIEISYHPSLLTTRHPSLPLLKHEKWKNEKKKTNSWDMVSAA